MENPKTLSPHLPFFQLPTHVHTRVAAVDMYLLVVRTYACVAKKFALPLFLLEEDQAARGFADEAKLLSRIKEFPAF